MSFSRKESHSLLMRTNFVNDYREAGKLIGSIFSYLCEHKIYVFITIESYQTSLLWIQL
nr:hypothetical protein [Vibrio alginolyticus]WKV19354.1 hypothetical protein [Vibrio parahaemolyticus]